MIGKSPVPIVVLVIGKLALALCVFFFLVKSLSPGALLYDSLVTRSVGIVLYATGLAIVLVALVQLGQSAAVGLPERNTELKTHGMYRFSRNPIYFGGFIVCIGSCLYSIHPVNILLCAIVIGIHLHIVRKEEEFLEKRFGQHWLDYKQHVPRFVRITRHTS